MACDPLGLQWIKDIPLEKPAPTSPAPGLIYMLCGAFQQSNDTPFDYTSEPIPIGPHYMICWPFDAEKHGFPSNVRDAGAWVMFDKTPYAYLHVCGTPWVGNVYHPERFKEAVWTMQYVPTWQTEM